MAGGDNVLVDPLSLILRQPVCVGTLGLLKSPLSRKKTDLESSKRLEIRNGTRVADLSVH